MVHSSLLAFCNVLISLLVPIDFLFIELFSPAPDFSLSSFIMFCGPSLLSAYFIFNIPSNISSTTAGPLVIHTQSEKHLIVGAGPLVIHTQSEKHLIVG